MKRNIFAKTVTAVSMMAASLSLSANTSEIKDVKPTETSGFYMSVGQVSLDEAVALSEGIDSSATSLKLGWEKQIDSFVWGLGLSGYLYDDNQGFTQRTRSNFGRESNSSSDANAFNLFIEAGYQYKLNESFSVSLLGGFESVMTSERGIGNCSDCHSEDIDIEAGLYFQPRISLDLQNDWYITLAHSSYMSGDVESNTLLTVGVQY